MPSIVKSMVVGLGLVVGASLAAQAQSVSSLPANGGVPTQNAVIQPSPPSVGLSPGATSTPTAEHYQSTAPYASNPTEHPYSASVDKTMAGPKPN